MNMLISLWTGLAMLRFLAPYFLCGYLVVIVMIILIIHLHIYMHVLYKFVIYISQINLLFNLIVINIIVYRKKS